MSFQDMNVMALKKVARQTGVDLGEASKKAEIIDVLEAEGVTHEYYAERFLSEDVKPVEPKAEEPKPKVKAKSDKVVLRLVSGWALLQTDYGTATQASPFIVVDAADVAAATESGDFRVASTEEVKEAYGL